MLKEEEEAIDISDDEQQPATSEARPPPAGKSSFDVQYMLNLEDLKNKGEEAGSQKLHKRLNKFFEYNKKIKPG